MIGFAPRARASATSTAPPALAGAASAWVYAYIPFFAGCPGVANHLAEDRVRPVLPGPVLALNAFRTTSDGAGPSWHDPRSLLPRAPGCRAHAPDSSRLFSIKLSTL